MLRCHLLQSVECVSSLFLGHASPKQSAPERGGGGGGGGPVGRGGGGNWYNSEWWQGFMNGGGGSWLLIGLSAAVVYLLVSGPTPTREISWQEFRRKYLDRGEVGEGRWGEVGSLVRAWQSVVWDVGRGGFTGQRWVHWSEQGRVWCGMWYVGQLPIVQASPSQRCVVILTGHKGPYGLLNYTITTHDVPFCSGGLP